MPLTSLGFDLGKTGNTVVTVIQGENFKLRCSHIQSLSSIAPSQAEEMLKLNCAIYSPDIVVLESNGPGYVFIDYLVKNSSNTNLPIMSVDTGNPVPDDLELELWDEIKLTSRDFLNIRALMYWITRLVFRDKRMSLYKEDPELFAQLSKMGWEFDENKKDKIKIESKRKMRQKFYQSELGPISTGRSPDKADSFCLAVLGYAILHMEHAVSSRPALPDIEAVIEPPIGFDGFFPIGRAGIEWE